MQHAACREEQEGREESIESKAEFSFEDTYRILHTDSKTLIHDLLSVTRLLLLPSPTPATMDPTTDNTLIIKEEATIERRNNHVHRL